MRILFVFILPFCVAFSSGKESKNQWELRSPDSKVRALVSFSKETGLTYRVTRGNAELVESSSLGVVLEDFDFSSGYGLTSASRTAVVKDSYTLYTGKRSLVSYKANEQTFHLEKSGRKLDVVFRVSDDGVAFRYVFYNTTTTPIKVREEKTMFNLPDNSKGFLQPMSVAKSGWSKVNPCYEEHYESGIPVSKPSSLKNGWVYPALFEVKEQWVLITEAGLDENYCGTHLSDGNSKGEFKVIFPQPEEAFPGGGLLPVVSGNSSSPWRIIVVGGLKTIIESNLGTDLAAKSQDNKASSYVKPGHSSWSWAMLKDDSITYSVQKKYIGYASDMGWDYCLIDVNWDTKIGYEKIRELADYGKERGVGLILWYNSAGEWNDAPYTPRNALLTHEGRIKEFSRISAMGIKGVKIDFFGGDGQSFIKYYLEILKDAAANNLLVNFHGATLPRGWQRTYPNLVSAEAIKGFEYVTFEQVNADLQPSHCAVLPFTRNAFDPMDFTPLSLYQVPRINRKTTSCFELALSVVFLSGVQHFVETPEGMAHMPDYVKQFLADLPVKWDETKFISGYPARDIVLARRSGNTWYVAGINGQDRQMKWNVDLSFAGNDAGGAMIIDGKEPLTLRKEQINSNRVDIEVPANGGFVMTLSKKEKL
jgi:alpha-glucosidase